jgi:hypothetical protein
MVPARLSAAAQGRLIRLRAALLVTIVLAARAAAADDLAELDRIPDAVTAADNAPESSASPEGGGRHYLQEEPDFISRRDDLAVPLVGSIGPDWINRFYADVRQQLSLAEELTATYSGRLNLIAESDQSFPTHGTVQHDFREGYLSWSPGNDFFFDLGRVNVRSGVGFGFNPTDFFKTRAVVDEVSLDPRVLRENRLGTFLARGQYVFEGGAVTVLYSPKLQSPSPITLANAPSFDPDFDRTNGEDRVLVKASVDLANDVSPEFLVLHQDGRWTAGANITRGLSDSTTAYLEWAGEKRAGLIEDALSYGVRTGSLPANVPNLFPGSLSTHFQNDLVAGLSYTTPFKLTLTGEYEYHQAGFSASDWRNWFRIGTARPGSLLADGELWYIRLYAEAQQEPLAQQSLFLRGTWDDALVPDLSLGALTNINLYDGSLLAQLTVNYKFSDLWSVGLLAGAYLGSPRSQYGSNPQAASLVLSLRRYF